MPFKSKAQQRKFGVMMGRGEISKKTFHEYARETDFGRLPERVKQHRAAGGLAEHIASRKLGTQSFIGAYGEEPYFRDEPWLDEEVEAEEPEKMAKGGRARLGKKLASKRRHKR